jgi:endoglucanase
VQLAEDCLHYLLGRNAVDTCFATGYGTRIADVYSSVYGGSASAFQPTPPGCVGGGVNQWESRGISAWPAKNWRNDPNNFTLNEVAIYYSAPLVFLAGYAARR